MGTWVQMEAIWLHHVVFWLFANISEEHTASIFRAEMKAICSSSENYHLAFICHVVTFYFLQD
jgi:hypothetical protein